MRRPTTEVSLASAAHPHNVEFRDAFDRVAHQLVRELDITSAVVLEREGQGWHLLGSAGLDAAQEDVVLALCERLDGIEEWIADAGRESRWSHLDLGRGRRGLRHLHWLPFARADGAALLLIDAQPREERRDAHGLRPLCELACDLLLAVRRGREVLAAKTTHQRNHQSQIALIERTAGLGSWSIETSGQRLECSPGLLALLAVEGDDVPGTLEAMLERHAPEWRHGLRQRIERCALRAEPFDEEVQILLEGVGPKWVRTVGDAVCDDAGDVVRVQIAVHDISATKQAQQETLRLAMRLTTTLASITEAFVTLDRQCCFTYLNQESERLLQKSTADLLGLELWHDFAPAVAQRLREQQIGRAHV